MHFSISGHITKVSVEKAEAMLRQVMLQARQLPDCLLVVISVQCLSWVVGLTTIHALDWYTVTLCTLCTQIPLSRLLLETDSPDGLPQVCCTSRQCSRQ